MTTFKAEVQHKKKDGTYNIKIRVTHNRTKRYIATPYYVTDKDLTRKGAIKNQHYIDLCDNLISDFRSRLENYGIIQKKFDIDRIMSIILESDAEYVSLLDIAKRYANDRKSSSNTIKAIACTINSLCRFMQTDDINIVELKSKQIKDWIRCLVDEDHAQSASFRIKMMRGLIAYAMKEYNDADNDITVIKYNACDDVDVPRPSQPEKRAISVEVFRTIRDFQLFGTRAYYRDMFLLSFYLVGMNAVDLFSLKKSNVIGNKIVYERTKTKNRRTDHARIEIEIQPEARTIINRYASDGDNLINAPTYVSSTFSDNFSKVVKLIQKEIDIPNVTFYSARHTWATLAVNECNVDKYTVHLALNHVDTKTAITDVYIKKDFSIIDKANRKVLDFVK